MIRRETEWKHPEYLGRRLGERFARLLVGAMFALLLALRASAGDKQPPSVPSGLTASAVTVTELTLGWLPASDNVKVTGYEVFKDGKAEGTSSDLTKRFSGLAPATTYHLAVRARDSSGNWSALSPALAVTTQPDLTSPTIPGGLSADEIMVNHFTLKWAASGDEVKTTGYEVFCNGESLGVSDERSKRIKDLAPATHYAMSVRARDAAGNWSERSEVLDVATLADMEAPSSPTELRARGIGETRFTLNWHPSKDNVRVTVYEVYQDGVSLGTMTPPNKVITGLAPGTSYKMAARAGDAAGNWSRLSNVLVVMTAPDTTRPSVPTGLSASSVGPAGFRLSWLPATDNVGVTGYEVLRDGVSAGAVSWPSLDLVALQPNTSYRMRVRARDAAGNWSAQSAVLNVRTAVADRTPPSAPSSLASSAVTPTGFTLSWTGSADDNGVKEYEVFRDGVSLGRTSQTTMTLTDLSPSTTYHLTVRACDAAGNWSEASIELVVTTSDGTLVAGFETDEGYHLGLLDGQAGWSSATNAEVVSSPVHGGRQALSIPATTTASAATRPYHIPADGVAFFETFALPFAAETVQAGVFFETEAAEVALVRREGVGQVEVFNGDGHGGGGWVVARTSVSLDPAGRASDWLRLTLRTDYSAKHWDAFVDGWLVAVNLGFAGEPIGTTGVVSLNGNSVTAAAFDEILVGPENPVFVDADRDAMDDAWEVAHGLNPAINDRDGDRDGDGISNLEEYLLGSDPASADADRDGIPDAQEVLQGTDPTRADTDGDGLPDGWELAQGLDPCVAADANWDADGDGQTNAQEYAAGTNPTDFYDGRALVIEPFRGTGAGAVDYAYDLSGRLITANYPSGRSCQYARDAAGNLTSISVLGTSPITAWRIAHDLPADGTGDGADDAILAGDGLPNLAKYAFGLDPRVAVSVDAPVVSRPSIGGGRYLQLTYQRPDPAPADLIYTVEVSPDGVTWGSGNGATVAMGTVSASGIASVSARDATPAAEQTTSRRIRLKIERRILP